MATKTSSGGARVEAWDPGIRAPGINQGRGAYAQGTVAEIPDYTKVNDAIQESIQKAAGSFGAASKIYSDKTKIEKEMEALGLTREQWNNKNGKEIEESSSDLNLTKDQKAAKVDDVINNTAGGSTDAYIEVANSLLGGKNYSDLKRREKIEVKRKLGNIAKIKTSMNEMMSSWAGADTKDINWNRYTNNPEARDFMQHILNYDPTKEGGKPFSFDFSNGFNGTIKYGDGKSISQSQLIAAKDLYASNKEVKKSLNETIDGIAAQTLKREDKMLSPTGSTPGVTTYDRITAINNAIGSEEMVDNYGYIWNNLMADRFGSNQRFVKYDAETHQEQVRAWLEETVNAKMGGQIPTKATPPPADPLNPPPKSGKLRFSYNGGYKDVDPALAARMEGLVPMIKGLSNQPKRAANEDLPRMTSDEWKKISSGSKQTSTDLFTAVDSNAFVGKANWKSFDDIIARTNDGVEPDDKEKDIIAKYKKHLNIFDAEVDLSAMFDKSTGVDNPEYNRDDKIFTYSSGTGDNIVDYNLDLKKQADREIFFALLAKRTGDDATDGAFVLSSLMQETLFTAYDPTVRTKLPKVNEK